MTPAETSPSRLSPPSRAMPMLRCRFGGLDCLLPLTRVIEIVRYLRPTPVPQTAPWVGGVINLRGRIHPVLDLAVKLGEPPALPDEQTCIVLVQGPAEHAGAPIGLIASRVATIHHLSRGDLDPPRGRATRIRAEFLEGFFRTPEGVVLVLDLERVLAAEELLIEAAPSPPSSRFGP